MRATKALRVEEERRAAEELRAAEAPRAAGQIRAAEEPQPARRELRTSRGACVGCGAATALTEVRSAAGRLLPEEPVTPAERATEVHPVPGVQPMQAAEPGVGWRAVGGTGFGGPSGHAGEPVVGGGPARADVSLAAWDLARGGEAAPAWDHAPAGITRLPGSYTRLPGIPAAGDSGRRGLRARRGFRPPGITRPPGISVRPGITRLPGISSPPRARCWPAMRSGPRR